MIDAFRSWRLCFIVSALFISVGGPQHPSGSMAEMLANPAWVPAHSLVLAGFVALLVGLVWYRRSTAVGERTRRWLRLAIIGAVLQTIEMSLHTAAAVDHAHLVAGAATPVLTTHLWLAVFAYPIFGVTMSGLIFAGSRDRVLGSTWIGWIGILGLLANGAAPPLVVALKVAGAGILFPFLLLFALWMLLAAFWPAQASRA